VPAEGTLCLHVAVRWDNWWLAGENENRADYFRDCSFVHGGLRKPEM